VNIQPDRLGGYPILEGACLVGEESRGVEATLTKPLWFFFTPSWGAILYCVGNGRETRWPLPQQNPSTQRCVT